MKKATYLRVFNSNGYIYNIVPATKAQGTSQK